MCTYFFYLLRVPVSFFFTFIWLWSCVFFQVDEGFVRCIGDLLRIGYEKRDRGNDRLSNGILEFVRSFILSVVF